MARPPDNPVAICKLKGWRLSMKRVRSQGCIDPKKHYGSATQCKHFKKIEDHPV